jgi:hypothetical protein
MRTEMDGSLLASPFDTAYCALQRRTEALLWRFEERYLAFPRTPPSPPLSESDLDRYLHFLVRGGCARLNGAARLSHQHHKRVSATALRWAAELLARAIQNVKDSKNCVHNATVQNLDVVIATCDDDEPVKRTMIRMRQNPIFHTLRRSWWTPLPPTKRQLLIGFADTVELIGRTAALTQKQWASMYYDDLKWIERWWYIEGTDWMTSLPKALEALGLEMKELDKR